MSESTLEPDETIPVSTIDDPDEKRAADRRSIRVPVSCWTTDKGEAVGRPEALICQDMSATGVALECETLHRINSLLEAEIHLPGRSDPLVCGLRVIRVETNLVGRHRYRIGANFVGISDADRAFVVEVLKKVNIYSIINEALVVGASDIHLTVGRPPVVRSKGRLYHLRADPVEEGHIKAMMYPLLSEAQIETFERERELDFAFSPSVKSRFRVNLHVQRGFIEASMRSVPTYTQSFTDLGLPKAALERICRMKSGLFLVAGTTGAGKTTTMSSMVDFVNRNLERVVISIEDPIEFTHTGKKSIVKQRELGSDTNSYAEALRRSLRQDPDMIVVGEMLEADGVISALRAAETGHLVISTIHAPDTGQALERLINFFPPEHAATIGQQVSSCLLGILFQALIPGTGRGQVLGTELMICNHAIKNLIREKRFALVDNCIQTGRKAGMYTLRSRLEDLLRKGEIEPETLEEYSRQS